MVTLLLTHVASPQQIPVDAAAAVAVVTKLLTWPVGQRFIGIDLARLLLTSEACAAQVMAQDLGMLSAGGLVPAVLELAGLSGAPPAAAAEQVLALKCMSNAFVGATRQAMLESQEAVIAAVVCIDPQQLAKPAFAPLATVLLKLATFFFFFFFLFEYRRCLR